jgi:hypothetical protein
LVSGDGRGSGSTIGEAGFPCEDGIMVLVRPFEEQDAQPLADLMMEMVRY